MSIKNNEIPKKLKEEILSQLKHEQDKFMQNVERKMEEHNNALQESIKKFEENKGFIEKILSNKYYFEKIESLDKISAKLNDGILAHEIRISKNISDINALRTKYDKIVLDNLLLPGQIGPSCQFKNLSQYLKNNIYEMTRMKADNESIKNIGNELKIRHDTNSKNISDLINNSVTRSNQYTDSRLNDCIAVLENKLKEMNEKLMEMRMKSIQSQEKLQEDMDNFKNKFEEKMKIQNDKILNCNNMVEVLNLRLPEEENILKSIKKLKSKYHHIKEFLLEFAEAYQPNQNNIINNNINNQSLQVRNRRNSMMMSNSQMIGMSDNNLEKIPQSPRKDIGLNSRFEENVANKERNNLLSPLRRQRQSTNINMNYKFKSNQKANIKLRLINISEDSSDDNEDKNESKKSKNINIKKNLNNNEKINNVIDSKKNKNKSNRSNRLDKGNKNKNNIKTKNNRNESKTFKKENSNFNSFDSNSDSSDNNYSKEKNKVIDMKSKKGYHNKKNTERILIQSKTISQQDKNINTSNNNSKINNNSNALSSINDNYNNRNIIPFNRFKNTFQSTSRNYNNQISNTQYSNLNSQTHDFYRTQQEEKKEIIKDFFSKYDRNKIQDNLNLIKNRGNLDLYNYSVSPPDKNHFLDIKNNEVYDPPISEELLFNKKNRQNDKFNTNIKISKMKYNIKLTSGNNFETNNKKIATMYNINNLGNSNFMNNKKIEYQKKFTNTYRGSLKMNSMNSSEKN